MDKVISENLMEIRERIESSAKKSGRTPDDITLIGVSKTIEAERVRSLVELGVHDLGENRVQELLQKQPLLADLNPRWHLIGHLQTNKVKYIIDKVVMIHSLDSLRLAEEINARAVKANLTANVLIEINIADEPSKFGVPPQNAMEFAGEISKLSNVKLRGLMCVAPFTEKSEENRIYFSKMRNLFIDIREQNYNNSDMDNLSMGMTGDYEVAIEEGATMVRIGTGIFGARDYSQ